MEPEKRSLSEIIFEAAKLKGLTVEKLAQLTNVSERFLVSLIDGKIEKLPSRPYIHGYLIKIAEVLGLDGEKLWREFLKDNETVRRSGKNDQLPKNRFTVPKIFNKKNIVFSIIIISFLVYFTVNAFSFFKKPSVDFTNLKESTTITSEKNFLVTGQTNPKNQLVLNNERLMLDKNGKFEKNIELQPGFNTLNFKVKKFLGKEYTITKQVFYQTSKNETQSPPDQNTETPNLNGN